MSTTVKNLNGTGCLSCKCNSWLDHWEKFTNGKAVYCSVIGCTKSAELGGHVIRQNGTDKSHYIIPLCSKCNKLTDAFETNATLVSANVQRTCG